MDFPFDCARQLVLGDFQIVGGLQVHPEFRAGVEVAGQTQGSIGRDSPTFVNYLWDTGTGTRRSRARRVQARAKRLREVTAQNLTGMDGGSFLILGTAPRSFPVHLTVCLSMELSDDRRSQPGKRSHLSMRNKPPRVVDPQLCWP
jgi:hypothetical protein